MQSYLWSVNVNIALIQCWWVGLSLVCLQVCLFFSAFLLKCAQIAHKFVYIYHIVLNKTNFYPYRLGKRKSHVFIALHIIVLQHNRSFQVVLKAAVLLSTKSGI